MKKTIYLLMMVALMFGSCTKVLDVEPTDSISSEVAIKDKVGVEKAIIGSYTSFQATGMYGRNFVIIGGLSADDLNWTGTTLEYDQFEKNNVLAENDVIDGIWSAYYKGLNRVNNVIDAMGRITDLSETERDNFEGEALFMRAMFHYNLATLFGGVPIKTSQTSDITKVDQAKNTAEEVYLQVIADLISAEAKLPVTNTTGRANKYAATAMLARVYLNRYHNNGDASYATLAIEKSDKVLTEGGYALDPVYSFLYERDSKEIIFEIVFDAQNKNRLAEYFYPRSLTGRYEIAPTTSLAQSYETGDIRLAASISTDSEGKLYCKKYEQISEGSDGVIVLRLAEMYLIKAEALAYTNGSIDAIQDNIDAVRERAGLLSTPANTYPALKLAVENERRHEFAFEGHRWFDLVRTKRATTLFEIDQNHTLFPIPLSEMQTNRLIVQNDGY